MLVVMVPQCSVEQRCAELQSLLETERSRVHKLEGCQEQLERRVRELDMEVIAVRVEAERETERLTSQAEVRWGHYVYPNHWVFCCAHDGFCILKTTELLPLTVFVLA